ncbi:type I-E CRISPR-associated protein Cse2/CasB [Maridesulfovibrio sp.]|uniref:type I-E CRISPR-associated protein Cse2/CasB n=1 Tax=Maridesulfovibrio sp. TaxID=2795000 RepID=UPI0029C9D0E0|nr:type I-E CRISPR-associated protein Cse2/CasB [Maridesulfovibrio sp.]
MKLRLWDILKDNENSSLLYTHLIDWQNSLENNRGERAKLKRKKNPLEVYLSEDFRRGIVHTLVNNNFDFNESSLERLALPVGLLAHAKSVDSESSFATVFAKTARGSKDMMDVRFRKLLSISDTDHDAFYVTLIRLTRLADDKLGFKNFLWGTCFWNDMSRRIWAKQYYLVEK